MRLRQILRSQIMLRHFYVRLLFALLFGAIGVFSYAPFHLWLLIFVSFAGFLILIADQCPKRAAIIGFFWGFGNFIAGTHWVYVSIKQYGELPTVIALAILGLLIIYLSLYPMLFAFLLRKLRPFAPDFSLKQLVLASSILWPITEFLRGYFLGGFSWLQLGYSQLDSPLHAYFPIFGIYGINFIVTSVSGLIIYIYINCKDVTKGYASLYRKMHFIGASIALTLIFLLPFGISSIKWTNVDTSRQITVSLIQGNIPQSLRWNEAQLNQTLNIYSELTENNINHSDIIIWPEVAITDIETRQQTYLHYLDELARNKNTSIIVGIIDARKNNVKHKYDIYNSLIVLGDIDEYIYPTNNRYIKHHLVPFGEYIPLEMLLKPIARLLNIPMSSMSSGPEIQAPLQIKDFKFTTAICYEIILPDLVRQNFTSDTDFLLTVSNDAWFGNTIGPWQHLQMAQARALELGRTLLRSTNNGITAVIAPNGNIVEQIPQFDRNVLTVTINPSLGITPYAKWGNTLFFILFAIYVGLLFIKFRKH